MIPAIHPMKTIHIILLTAFAAGVAALSPAVGQQDSSASRTGSGPLATMPHGPYACALPGDAGGAAYERVQAEDFRIIPASRYTTAKGEGTYIMRGKSLQFTRGPKKGERFERIGDNQLRKVGANGAATELLCTRGG